MGWCYWASYWASYWTFPHFLKSVMQVSRLELGTFGKQKKILPIEAMAWYCIYSLIHECKKKKMKIMYCFISHFIQFSFNYLSLNFILKNVFSPYWNSIFYKKTPHVVKNGLTLSFSQSAHFSIVSSTFIKILAGNWHFAILKINRVG